MSYYVLFCPTLKSEFGERPRVRRILSVFGDLVQGAPLLSGNLVQGVLGRSGVILPGYALG